MRQSAKGCNPHSTSFETSVNVVQQLIGQLLQTNKVKVDQVSSIGIGISGLGREEDQEKWYNLFQSNGRIYEKTKLIIENDAIIALYSGTYGKDGLVSINGTGSICYGVKDDKVQRSGGWGHLIAADPGSGYYIGYNGLNAVFRAYDGLGKETVLTEQILAHFNERDVPNLIQHIYEKQDKVIIARLAKIILNAATNGDHVAREIIELTSEKIVENSSVVYHNLFCTKQIETPFVMIGGIFQNAYLRERVERLITLEIPNVKLIFPHLPPVYGAIVLALKLGGYSNDHIQELLRDH